MFIKGRSRDPSFLAKMPINYTNVNNASLELWPNIFKLLFNITTETKFQYRLLHRVITLQKTFISKYIV